MTRTARSDVRRSMGRPTRAAVAATALSLAVLAGCSSSDVTESEAQEACAGQLERAGVEDISWDAAEEVSDGLRLTGTGAESGGTVEVECEVDRDGTVRRSTSGGPE